MLSLMEGEDGGRAVSLSPLVYAVAGLLFFVFGFLSPAPRAVRGVDFTRWIRIAF